MEIYAVIMAGGSGTRFWPLSRKKKPKQLLKLTGDHTMIEEVIRNVGPLVKREHLYIVTTEDLREQVREAVMHLVPTGNILGEPCARNTAPCIGYAALHIRRKHGEGVLCILPSDQYIGDRERFRETLRQTAEAAVRHNKLLTVGIRPDVPSTGYGYIRYRKDQDGPKDILDFKEKPDFDTAKRYLESGDYLWNSGMFITRITVLLAEYERYLPRMLRNLSGLLSAGGKGEAAVSGLGYADLPSVSIDTGIMERTENGAVIPGEFGWSDVGSFEAMGTILGTDENHNSVLGSLVQTDTSDLTVLAKGRLVAAVGVQNLVIVETEDAVLVCGAGHTQEVKQVVKQLKDRGMEEYL